MEKNDGFPQNLCSACLEELIKTYDFREKSLQNDILLRRSLIKQDDILMQLEEHGLESPTNECCSSSETNKEAEKNNTRERSHICMYCNLGE